MDLAITATADTNETTQTQGETIAILVAQLATRLVLLAVAISLLASTPALRNGQLDELMLAFRGYFATQLLGVLVCLFLRVYRVMLASYTSEFPTIKTYWEQPAYHILYLLHIATTLLYYYMHISSAYQLGICYGGVGSHGALG